MGNRGDHALNQALLPTENNKTGHLAGTGELHAQNRRSENPNEDGAQKGHKKGLQAVDLEPDS